MNLDDDFEKTWFYQEMMQKVEKKVRARAQAEVRAQVQAEDLRDMLIHLTTLRFPDLASQAQKQAESQEQLRAMIDKLFTATTVQEARDAFIS